MKKGVGFGRVVMLEAAAGLYIRRFTRILEAINHCKETNGPGNQNKNFEVSIIGLAFDGGRHRGR